MILNFCRHIFLLARTHCFFSQKRIYKFKVIFFSSVNAVFGSSNLSNPSRGARFMSRLSRPKIGMSRLSRPNIGMFRLSRSSFGCFNFFDPTKKYVRYCLTLHIYVSTFSTVIFKNFFLFFRHRIDIIQLF